MADDNELDSQVFLTEEELMKRWQINHYTLRNLLVKYPLQVYELPSKKEYSSLKAWEEETSGLGRLKFVTVLGFRLSSIKEFERQHPEVLKIHNKQSSRSDLEAEGLVEEYQHSNRTSRATEEDQQQSATPAGIDKEKWATYLAEVKKERKHYSDAQAHYWRARCVFRYLENAKGLTPAQAAIRSEIKDYACEGERYGSDRIETWLSERCQNPEDYEKSKKWGQEDEHQVRRQSRLRECLLALSLVFLSETYQRLTWEELVSGSGVKKMSSYVVENDLSPEKEKRMIEKVATDKTLRTKWLKPLRSLFQKAS